MYRGAPRGLDVARIKRELAAGVPGVEDIHHVHVWSLDEKRPMITLHARIADLERADECKAALRERLAREFGIAHATIGVEGVAANVEPATCSG